MWREFIQSLYYGKDCTFSEPATAADIAEVESALGVALPDELRSVLEESNGVIWHYKPPHQLWAVWSTQKMIETNQRLRAKHRERDEDPFESYLGFADIGPTAYRVVAGKAITPEVVIVGTQRVRSDLRRFIEHLLSED